MNVRWDELWPTQEPPEDFALRLLHEVAVKRKRRQKTWLLAALIPSLVVCLCLGLVFKQHREDAQKRAVILEAQRRDTEDRLRRLQNEFEMARHKEEELQASLANSKDETTRRKLQAELDLHRRAISAGRASRGPAKSSTGDLPYGQKDK